MINFLEKKRYFAVILFLLIAIEIFYISSIEISADPRLGMKLRPTVYHITVFFLFNFFLIISLNKQKKLNLKLISFAILISVIYAVLDEIHQAFTPGRVPSIKDVMLDSVGIFFSALTYIKIKKNQ